MSRQALLTSAITFLRDPTTAASPLAQRVAFLESKGLTPPEIEQALSAASSSQVTGTPYYDQRAGRRRGIGDEFERDWRDWFIMAVVGGTVGYGVVKLAQKYLVPHLQPPSSTELEAAQKALEAKYDEAASLLTSLKTSTDALAAAFDEQKEAVDNELAEVRKAVDEMRDGERKREEWSRKIESQVEEVVTGLPSMLEKQSAAQAQSLTDLQTELKSLKSLLIARRPTPSYDPTSSSTSTSTSSSTPASSAPRASAFNPIKQGIPSWQYAATNSTAGTPPSASVSMSTPPTDKKQDPEDPSASGVLVEKPDETVGGSGSSGTVAPAVAAASSSDIVESS